MSIQAQCREAMNTLATEGGVFTEIDVVNHASQGKGWTEKLFREAADRAYSVLQSAYKNGHLVRFGPVEYRGTPDYARKATKIVYADPERGPRAWETPNGTFPRILAPEGDPLSAPGRKSNEVVGRDDTRPWDEQRKPIRARHLRSVATPDGSGPPIDPQPLLRRIEQLEAEVREWREKAESTGKENSVLLDALADRLTPRVVPQVAEAVKESVAEAMLT
jgi:hypothetical protein